MDHKAKYKHKSHSVKDIKDKRRKEDVSIRKDKREKIISSKRFRFGDGDLEEENNFTEEQVIQITQRLKQGSHRRVDDLRLLRQAFATGSLYVDAFFRVDGSLQCIVGLLSGSDEELQLEAAWCLTNIAAGIHEHVMAVAKTAAPYLITFLNSGNQALQDQCAWALGNLAGDSPECRDLLCTQGVVAPLVKLLQSPCPAVVKSAAFALSNITRESETITSELVRVGVLDVIPRYLHLQPDNRETLAEVAWILTYLSTTQEHVPALVERGMLMAMADIVVKLAAENPHDAQTATPLLRCLGNICSGPDEYSLAVCENPGFLHALSVYLDSSVRHITKETLWVISNIAGEASIATAISSGPILDQVISKLSGGFDIKQEALYVLNNFACRGAAACDCLLQRGLIQALVPILKSHDVDLLNLALALCEIILRLTEQGSSLFEKFEGVARLEGLEYHSNEDIAGKANQLLESYFYLDDEQENDTG